MWHMMDASFLAAPRAPAHACMHDCSRCLQGCEHGLAKPIKVVGMGGCAVDYLASVAAYPKPDQKLRSETLEVSGLPLPPASGGAAGAWAVSADVGRPP